MTESATDRTGAVLDLWLALLAGERVWQDGSDRPAATEQGTALFAMLTLGTTLLVQWAVLAVRVDPFGEGGLTGQQRDLLLLAAASVLAVALLAVDPMRIVFRRPVPSAPFLWSVLWRAAAYIVLIAATAGIVPRFRFLVAIPLGLVGGTDAFLTLWTLGVRPSPRRWVRRFVFSTVHFGVLGAMLATALLTTESDAFARVASLYAAMWVGIIVAGLAIVIIDRISRTVEADTEAYQAETRAQERARRSHWLHDDVLSEVRLATLRIQQGGDAATAQHELQDLDHRLRLRQLDEIVQGGQPHLYEILQPHLRRAQSLGIDLFDVPSLDESQRRVDERTGELVNRAVSVLMSNATNAGATRLCLHLVEHDAPPALEISVGDNAGGFDLDAVPPGRGLSMLQRDLGPGGVTRADFDNGSLVTVCIPIGTSPVTSTEEGHTA